MLPHKDAGEKALAGGFFATHKLQSSRPTPAILSALPKVQVG
jgi:hypothetical protein